MKKWVIFGLLLFLVYALSYHEKKTEYKYDEVVGKEYIFNDFEVSNVNIEGIESINAINTFKENNGFMLITQNDNINFFIGDAMFDNCTLLHDIDILPHLTLYIYEIQDIYSQIKGKYYLVRNKSTNHFKAWIHLPQCYDLKIKDMDWIEPIKSDNLEDFDYD